MLIILVITISFTQIERKKRYSFIKVKLFSIIFYKQYFFFNLDTTFFVRVGAGND